MTLSQSFINFPSQHISIVATTDIVYPNPHQHSIPRSLTALLRLLPPIPSRTGDPSGLSCILDEKSRPEWSQRFPGRDFPCRRFSALGTIRPPIRLCSPLPDRSGRCLLSRSAQSFPPRGWQVCNCAHRRTPVTDERSDCACTPQTWKQLIRLGQRRLPAHAPLLVRVGPHT